AVVHELPPFCGGAVGYTGYDTVRYAEHLPDAPPDDRSLPDLSFAFFDSMVIFDNVTKTMTVVAMARVDEPSSDGRETPPSQAELKRAYQDACHRIDRLVATL